MAFFLIGQGQRKQPENSDKGFSKNERSVPIRQGNMWAAGQEWAAHKGSGLYKSSPNQSLYNLQDSANLK